ncbi:MAG: hypothetical protein LQ343_002947 [Gyalolechia ehrenbergii]|nr:MAG: hypothetical protein LQ343_002947 [Gyalolechia ehrenbergii]
MVIDRVVWHWSPEGHDIRVVAEAQDTCFWDVLRQRILRPETFVLTPSSPPISIQPVDEDDAILLYYVTNRKGVVAWRFLLNFRVSLAGVTPKPETAWPLEKQSKMASYLAASARCYTQQQQVLPNLLYAVLK